MADGTVKITIEADGNKAIKSAKDLDNVFGQLGKGGKTNGLTSELDGVAKHSDTAKLSIMDMAAAIGLVKVASAAFNAVKNNLGNVISEGAKLQQSLGGVETLFKSSAGKVKKYANDAFKTAGLSANDYMENVTSFSASLISSMGGDTAKAAKVANMAMVDMSDNANKMGTNIGDIQNAYQGFAKQNYTMLDNLKLGYGGTQEEMKRLLADATKISHVKYDINNLSDVYNAIHVIQKNLDITGTTAKEAASTFSGSFDSMAAATKNVAGRIALGMDIKPALNDLAKTMSTFIFGNFIPMITNIFKALPSAIAQFVVAAIPQIAKGGREMAKSLGINFNSGIGSFASDAGQIFMKAFSPLSGILKVIAPVMKIATVGLASFIAVAGTMAGIVKVISGVTQAFNILKLALLANPFALFVAGLVMVGVALVQVYKKSETFRNFVDKLVGTVKSALPSFDSFKKAFSGIGQVLGGGLTSIIAKVSDVIKGFADNFKQFKIPSEIFNLKLLIPILGALFSPIGMVVGALKLLSLVLGNGMIQSGITSMVAGFATFSSTIAASAPQIGESVGTLLGGILTAIAAALPQIISGGLRVVAGLISGIAQGIPSLTGAAIQLIAAFTLAIAMLIPTITASALSIVAAFTSAMVTALPILIASGAAILIAFIQGLTSQLPGIVVAVGQLIVTFLTALTGQLPGILNAGINLLLTFINGITSRIPGIVPTVINMIVTFLNSVTANLPRILNAGINLLIAFLNGIARKVPSMIGAAVNVIVAFINGIAHNLGRVVNAAMNLVDAMVRGVLQAQNRLLNAATTLINGFADNIRSHKDAIRGAALNLLDAMIRVFVPDSLVDAGEAIIRGFLGGLKRGFEKVKGFVGGIASWIKKHKGPISYDKKLLIPAGNAIMNGLNNGLVDKFGKVKQSIATLTSSIANSAVITMPAIEDSAFNKSLKRINNTLNSNRLSAGLSFAGITAESATGIGRGVTPTNSVVNNYGGSSVVNNNGNPIDDRNRTYEIHIHSEIDGREVAKGSAKFMQTELEKNRVQNLRLGGVRY